MGRKRKRTKHLKQYQEDEYDDIEEEEVTLLQIYEFVIAMLYCGFPEMEAQKFDILTGHRPPTYREITEALNKLRPILLKMARECVEKERKKMPKNSSICVDGSWDHHKDGKLLVFDVICIQTKKIIDFEVEIRDSKKRRGNTKVSAPAMEGLAFRTILPRLMSYKNIVELIKDGDVEVESILKESGWNILINPDPNHLLIHFRDHFDKAVESHKNMFRGIADKVLKQLIYILYEDTEKDVKFKKILDMKKYILTQPLLKLGRSTKKHKWKYADNEDAQKCLDKVINLCFQIADIFNRGHTTCLNESFHFVKAKYLPKNFNLGNTGDIRLYCAILQFNIGDAWLELIYDTLKLPLKNIKALKEFRPKAHSILRGIIEDNDFFAEKSKEEEKEQQNQMQMQIDKKNHIPLHS